MIEKELEIEAKNLLKDFLEDTLSFLHTIVHEGVDEEGQPLFVESLLPEIKKAWEEFQKDFDKDKAQRLILETSGTVLQSHGLYGYQIRLKLSAIANWRNRFSGQRMKKILLRLLDALDTLLDSIIAATGIDEALKEIKDVLRNSIDED